MTPSTATQSPASSSKSPYSRSRDHHCKSPTSTAATAALDARTSTSTSSLTFPSAIFKGSFANLFKALRTYHRRGSIDSEEEDEDEEVIDLEEGDVDQDSLMWDAQTALIAHQIALAVKLYTQAALPPYRSSSACLALGNLLIRGSTLAEHDGFSSPSPPSSSPSSPHLSGDVKGKSKASNPEQQSPTYPPSAPSFFSRLFGSPPSVDHAESSSTPSQIRPEPMRTRTADLVASGWEIPREGKRAVRDSKSMGVAAGWFILGLGWVVQEQLEREERERADRHRQANEQAASRRQASIFLEGIPDDVIYHAHVGQDQSIPEDEVLSFGSKSRSKTKPKQEVKPPTSVITQTHDSSSPSVSTTSQDSTEDLQKSSSTITASGSSGSTSTLCPPESDPCSSSGRTTESPMIQTPGGGIEPVIDPFSREKQTSQSDEEALQQILDLLSPLLHLYRHGHIQAQDPVSLPPISLQQLPTTLKPKNETDKRRNVWRLGGALSAQLITLDLLKSSEADQGEKGFAGNVDKLRAAVNILTNYILAMTSRDSEAEVYFRNVMATSPTGIVFADDLIRQAAKRLDILSSTPCDESDLQAFPFPQTKVSSDPKQPKSFTGKGGPDYFLSPPKLSSKTSPSRRRGSSPILAQKQDRNHHRQPSSTASISSTMSTAFPRILSSPVKASPSVASLSISPTSDSMTDAFSIHLGGRQVNGHMSSNGSSQLNDDDNNNTAISTLRRIHAKSLTDLSAALDIEGLEDHGAEQEGNLAQYPSLTGWRMSPPPASSFGTSHVSQRTIMPASLSNGDGPYVASAQESSAARPWSSTAAGLSSSNNFKAIPTGLSVSPADTLRPVASSPQISSLRLSQINAQGSASPSFSTPSDLYADNATHRKYDRARTNPSTPRRRLPFEPTGDIAPIDPSLAAAELSSALTKHVTCGVCGGSGVNFPECRKCGLTFCSRDCRVAEDKAGNGKKHICGAWESRRLLSIPTNTAQAPRSKPAIAQSDFDGASTPIRATKVF
ncbi:hypothetical protein IAU59_004039 [Kwoniella sp. CBS 9459]